MTIPSVTYPLDLTGTSTTNLVQDEVYQLPARKVRALATKYGPFYVNSLKVIDSSNGRVLMRGRDYFATEFCETPSGKSGKDVCSIVLVTDQTVSNTVAVSYQVVGGPYSNSDNALADLLNSIDFDKRNPNWPRLWVSPEEIPATDRLFGRGYRYGFEYATQTLERIAQAILSGDALGNDALYVYMEANLGKVTPDLVLRTQYALTSALGKHRKAPDPHPQYLLRKDKIVYQMVRQPVNKVPADGTGGVSNNATLVGDTYGALYRVPQQAARFQLSTSADMSMLVADVVVPGATTTFQPSNPLVPGTRYYWRVMYQSVEGDWSQWSKITTFSTVNGGINQPAITAPANGATGIPLLPTISASAFSLSSGNDVHVSTDWEIWTGPNGTGSLVFSSTGDTVNKTSITMKTAFAPSTTLYPRVRYHSNVLPVTGWSNAVSFTTAGSGVVTPSLTTPTNGAVDVLPAATLQSSAFAVVNATDTHASTDWEVWTGPSGTGVLVYSSNANAINKLSITLPAGTLGYSGTYHPRVRHRGTTLGASNWSAEVAFTTKAAPPAAGTVLDSRCQGVDLYNLVADGNYGANWTLAQTNSGTCGYVPPAIATPTWASADNRSLTDRLGSITENINPFTMTSGSDTFAKLEWEVYNGAGSLIANGQSTTLGAQPVIYAYQLVNHTSYKIRARYTGVNSGASNWSDFLNFATNWADSPAAGTVLRTYCSGYDKYEERSDGNYGSTNVLVETNSTYCGYIPPPAAGTELSTYCDGTTLMKRVADGVGGYTNQVKQYNSVACGYVPPSYPAAGTELSTYCSGTTLYARIADGAGGYDSQVKEYNSTSCGYVPPQNPPAGQELSTYCDGTTLMKRVADGYGGFTVAVKENNSVTCGYVPPSYPPKGTELSTYCDGTTWMARLADGNGGWTPWVKEFDSRVCGYVPPVTVDPAGTEYSRQCFGTNLWGRFADGVGGAYWDIIESDSTYCGYSSGDYYPVAGSLNSVYCKNGDLWGYYADGYGGETTHVFESPSDQCRR